MEITLKAIKGTTGREGQGFLAKMLVDGKHVADVADYGDGAAMYYTTPKGGERSATDAALRAAREQVATLVKPAEKMAKWEKELHPDGLVYAGPEGLDYFLARLVDEADERKRIGAACKKGLIVKIEDGRIMTYKVTDTPENRERVRAAEAKRGNANPTFLNDQR